MVNESIPQASAPRRKRLSVLGEQAKAALFKFTEPNLDLPLSLLRWAVGLILVASYGQLILDYDSYFGRYGMVPVSEWGALKPEHSFSYFNYVHVLADQKIIAFAALVPMLCFWWGIFPRISALLSWYCLISVHDRCPVILDGGDIVLRLVLFFFIFAKSDRRLSPLAPLLPKDPTGSFPVRLVQFQIALVYLCTGLEKIRGQKWQQGNALAYVLRLDSFARADWSHLANFPLFVNLMTYGTLAFEIGFIFLVWQRKTRGWVLASGIAMHLGIELLMYVPMFSWVMMSSYFAFLYPEWAEVLVTKVTAPYRKRALAAGLSAEVASAPLLGALERLDVWNAVRWSGPAVAAEGAAPAKAAAGAVLTVRHGTKTATGAGAYWLLARAVPSFLALAPVATIPGGEKLVVGMLTKKRAPSPLLPLATPPGATAAS